MDQSTPDTRARILDTAMELFEEQGYQRTSVREIAERLGFTKTAVLYHFPSKSDIPSALAEPMLTDLENAVVGIDRSDPAAARWAVVEGVLDVWITHQRLLRTTLSDLAILSHTPVFKRFRDAMATAIDLVGGPNPGLTGRVRAAQVVSMLSDPVILFADAPEAALRREVLAGVRMLLGEPAPRPTTRHRGRPSAMRSEMVATARRMHDEGHSADRIASTLGVSRATVYRHLNG
jgi:AcrR family transcriptional regulator